MRTTFGAALTAAVLVAFFMLSTIAAPASANTQISWNYYVFATGGDGIPVMSDGNSSTMNSVYGTYDHSGHPVAGNFASADFFADYAYGAVGARASAVGALDPGIWPYAWTATGRVERISLQDELTFTVAPGDYPEGVTVGVSCLMAGFVSATEYGQCHLSYSVNFGGQVHTRHPVIEIGESGTVPIRDVFTLELEILPPGPPRTEPLIIDHGILLDIFNAETGTTRGSSPNYVMGSAAIDVYHALQVTEVIAPAGVTWESESGIFLSQPTTTSHPVTDLATVLLHPNYPNPFNPSTTIAFTLAHRTQARLRVFDLRGRELITLVDGVLAPGRHEVPFRSDELAAGTYSYVLEAEGRRLIGRMVLIK